MFWDTSLKYPSRIINYREQNPYREFNHEFFGVLRTKLGMQLKDLSFI